MTGGLSFDLTLRLGDLIVLVGVIGGIFGAYHAIKGKIATHDQNLEYMQASIDDLKEDQKQLKQEIKTQAVQDQRIEHLNGLVAAQADTIAQMVKDIGDLRRGEGFIQGALNAEWSRMGRIRSIEDKT